MHYVYSPLWHGLKLPPGDPQSPTKWHTFADLTSWVISAICWLLHHTSLVGGWATPLKNMKVARDYYSQYMGKNAPNHQPRLDSCYSWNCHLSSRNFCWYWGGSRVPQAWDGFLRKIFDCPPELANPRLFIPIWRGSIYPGLPIQHHIYGNILEYTVSGQYIQ